MLSSVMEVARPATATLCILSAVMTAPKTSSISLCSMKHKDSLKRGYRVLGSQVNVRSSILGDGGTAKEAQSKFLMLMKDAIRQLDLSKSVQRYQLAVDEAKVRLDFVPCPGTWLMPSRMVINTASTVGYNNQLKQATTNMKLGVNNNINTETKKVGLRLMDGGPSKVKEPNSHPSNPIHKAAMKAQGMEGRKKEAPKKQADAAPNKEAGTKHGANKIMPVVAAIGVAGLLVFPFSRKL